MICFLVLHRNAITQIVCLALLKALAWTVNSVLGCSHLAAELQQSAQKSCGCEYILRALLHPQSKPLACRFFQLPKEDTAGDRTYRDGHLGITY